MLPVKRGKRCKKNPGSVVGKGWQRQSSRDPKVITAWFAGTEHLIALHCGRSGVVVFDVDNPDKLPEVLARHLCLPPDTVWHGGTPPKMGIDKEFPIEEFVGAINRKMGSLTAPPPIAHVPPYQSSRPDQPGRGHYVFAMPLNRTIGNSGGRLGGDWGEVRGLNGVIIGAPSQHSDKGGEYRWQRGGLVPEELPVDLADQIDDASPATDAASDAVVNAFIDQHTTATRPEQVDVWANMLQRKIGQGRSPSPPMKLRKRFDCSARTYPELPTGPAKSQPQSG